MNTAEWRNIGDVFGQAPATCFTQGGQHPRSLGLRLRPPTRRPKSVPTYPAPGRFPHRKCRNARPRASACRSSLRNAPKAMNFGKLAPHDILNEPSGRPHHDCRPALSRVAIGPEPIASAEGNKQPDRPGIRHRELHFDRRILSADLRQFCPQAPDRRFSRNFLTRGADGEVSF